jgi:hypothetical protein
MDDIPAWLDAAQPQAVSAVSAVSAVATATTCRNRIGSLPFTAAIFPPARPAHTTTPRSDGTAGALLPLGRRWRVRLGDQAAGAGAGDGGYLAGGWHQVVFGAAEF